jgi:hypothetical protein
MHRHVLVIVFAKWTGCIAYPSFYRHMYLFAALAYLTIANIAYHVAFAS